MGRIQRYAEGFLSLVGNKVGGREPTSLSDVVIPSVDMTQLLLGRTLASEGGISLTSAVGDQVTLEVPDGEIWLLRNVSFEAIRVSATRQIVVMAYLTQMPGSTDPVNYSVILGDFAAGFGGVQNNSLITSERSFDVPFVLTPGVQIVFEVTDNNNAAIAWSGKALLYKLQA